MTGLKMTLKMYTLCLTVLMAGTCLARSTGSNNSSVNLDLASPPPADKQFVPKMLSFVFNVLDIKGVISDVKLGKTSSTSCTACKFGMSMLQDFLESGKSEDEIANTVITVCKTLNLFSPAVCDGTVENFKSQVLYVMAHVTLSSDEVCGLLLGPSCATAFNPLHNWTIPLPDVPKPPIRPVKPPKAGSPVLKVLQLTDVHYDPKYLEGSNAACNDPLCCRNVDGPATKASDKAGRFGDYRSCDTPYETLDSMLSHISEQHEIDYVIWTGDIGPHDIWNVTRSEVLHLLHVTSDMIKRYFPNSMVYPSLGNHEGVPVNSFPPSDAVPEFSISWLYNELVNTWGPWLTKEAEVTLKKGGFYSVKVRKGLRIISVNSNFCNSFNFWLFLNSTDPSQQLEWLTEELLKAEQNNEKVHIISHIPPGKQDCLKVWSHNFNQIINRFESTVMAQFYGHTHQDEFELFYDTDGRATNVAYISPSVTTYGGVNPAYRIYTVDASDQNSTWAILDHESYFLNLTEANANGRADWKKAYSAKELYGMESLQPSDWDQLVTRFQEDDDLFHKFYRFFTTLSDFPRDPCQGNCKADTLCSLRTSQSNDPSICSST